MPKIGETIKFLFLSSVIIFFLASCNLGKKSISQVVTSSSVNSGSDTITDTYEFPKSDNNNSLVQNASTDIFDFQEKAVAVEDDNSFDFSYKQSGLIVYTQNQEHSSSEVYLQNLEDCKNRIIISEKDIFHNLSVSVDNSVLAYELVTESNGIQNVEFVYHNYLSGEITKIPWNDDTDIQSILNWGNGNSIIIGKFGEYPEQIDVLNIITGERIKLPYNFSDQVIVEKPSTYSNPVYNATFEYVIYPAYSDEGQKGYKLYNITTQEIVSFIPTDYLQTTIEPVWNNDGDRFLIAMRPIGRNDISNELFYGDTTGETKLISNLTEYFGIYSIQNIVWSPDGKYAAIVVVKSHKNEDSTSKLLILDFENKIIYNTSIEIDYIKWRFGSLSDNDYPIWSPDSKEIIVENQTDYGKNEVILLNISDYSASKIEFNKRILGWVKFQ